MTELEFAIEVKKADKCDMNWLENISSRLRIGKTSLGTVRRNMIHAHMIDLDYKPTSKLALWLSENLKNTAPLTIESFRPADKAASTTKIVEPIGVAPVGRPTKTPEERQVFDSKDAHMNLCATIHETWAKKNKDYGDSFHVSCSELGLVSCLVRMSDKWLRIKSLMKQPAQVADESMRDTLMDLANYALMTVMEIDRGTIETEG